MDGGAPSSFDELFTKEVGDMRPPGVWTVGLVVGATAALTAFHFTDNIVSVDTYSRRRARADRAVSKTEGQIPEGDG
jgi:hypothetical protein